MQSARDWFRPVGGAFRMPNRSWVSPMCLVSVLGGPAVTCGQVTLVEVAAAAGLAVSHVPTAA
jgi:hypothetical protein